MGVPRFRGVGARVASLPSPLCWTAAQKASVASGDAKEAAGAHFPEQLKNSVLIEVLEAVAGRVLGRYMGVRSDPRLRRFLEETLSLPEDCGTRKIRSASFCRQRRHYIQFNLIHTPNPRRIVFAGLQNRE